MSNTFIGNSFMGFNSGYSNTTAYGNIFIGDSSGYENINGVYKVFVGNYSGIKDIYSCRLENNYTEIGLKLSMCHSWRKFVLLQHVRVHK